MFNYNEKKYNYVKTHFYDKKPIDEILHKELLEDFKLYMLLGGMPEVVLNFFDSHDLNQLLICICVSPLNTGHIPASGARFACD